MRILNLSGRVDTAGYTSVYTIAGLPDVVAVDLYDRTFGVGYPERVEHVTYQGYVCYLYNGSPLKPWVGLLRSIFRERYQDTFHITGESGGFKVRVSDLPLHIKGKIGKGNEPTGWGNNR